MTTHTDENPSTPQESPGSSNTLAIPSGDIKVEKIEDNFDFFEDDEMYKEEELEDVKLNYEETKLMIKEENEDFSKKMKPNKEPLETKVVIKEELLIIEEDIEGKIEE